MADTSPQYSVRTVSGEDRTVVVLGGEIDIATVDDVSAAVRAELARGPVLLDLRELTFIDSSGLRMLVELLRSSDESGHPLTIGREVPRG